jgi:hypothetical protein
LIYIWQGQPCFFICTQFPFRFYLPDFEIVFIFGFVFRIRFSNSFLDLGIVFQKRFYFSTSFFLRKFRNRFSKSFFSPKFQSRFSESFFSTNFGYHTENGFSTVKKYLTVAYKLVYLGTNAIGQTLTNSLFIGLFVHFLSLR